MFFFLVTKFCSKKNFEYEELWSQGIKEQLIIQGVNLKEVKVIVIRESSKIQNMSWDLCLYFPKTGTFWYLASKKIHNYSAIIPLWKFWRCITVEICSTPLVEDFLIKMEPISAFWLVDRSANRRRRTTSYELASTRQLQKQLQLWTWLYR